MFALEPGPLTLLDPAVIRPLQYRGSYTAIVADGLAPSDGLRAVLTTRQLDVTDNPPVDLDYVHATTIGRAADIVTTEIAPAPGSPVPGLLETGDNANAISDSVAQYLPPSETPLNATLKDPPPPLDGFTGDRPPPPDIETLP
ncbi:MAG TPA: hypothetical protein VKQ05_03395 [Gemmatimonadales bacterium]|nr:hypothetical protein [Gemmatimonadales bacterium]